MACIKMYAFTRGLEGLGAFSLLCFGLGFMSRHSSVEHYMSIADAISNIKYRSAWAVKKEANYKCKKIK